MDNRTHALHRSMVQISEWITQDDELLRCAAQSTAFAFFNALIADFERLREEERTTPLLLAELRTAIAARKADLRMCVERIRATAAVMRDPLIGLDHLAPPPLHVPTFRFYDLTDGIVTFAEQNVSVFVENGMNAAMLSDARVLMAELADLDHRYCFLGITFASFRERVQLIVDAAQKRKHQLHMELLGTLTAQRRAEWKKVASLGRVHRPKALAAGTPRKLLAAPGADGVPGNAAETPDRGVRGLARQVVLRIAGRDTE